MSLAKPPLAADLNVLPAIGGRVDIAIAKLAATQHGVVARRQLEALGIGARAIEHRLETGRLHRLHRGIYAVGHLALTPSAHALAAVLAAGPGAALSHRSAAWVWGIRRWAPYRTEIAVPHRRRPRRDIRIRVLALSAGEVTEHEGIRVTSPSRTLFDLAAVLAPQQVEAAFHEAEFLRLTSLVSVPELLERHPGRPGAATLRRILDRSRPQRTRTEMEADFLAFTDARGFPRPETNVARQVNGRYIEADAVFVRERLIVELDGGSHLTLTRFHDDRARDRSNLADGWRTIRVTERHLYDEPDALEADLDRLVPRRSLVPRSR